MALKIEFEGWVNEVKDFSWGRAISMTHQQRAQNRTTGEWETVGKDYLDVSVSHDSEIVIPDGKLLRVFGNLKVETYVKRDGSTAVALKVRATRLEAVERDLSAVSSWNDSTSTPTNWTRVEDEDAPF